MAERDGTGAGGTSGSETTVYDDLSAAWDEAERAGDGGGSTDGGDNSRGARSESPVDTGINPDDKKDTTSERLRNPDGTFAAKVETPADQKAPADQQAAPADQKAAAPKPESKPGSEQVEALPNGWNVAAEDWQKTPPSIRAQVLKREAEVNKGWQQINQTIAPLAQVARTKGIPWQEGLSRLVNGQNRLDANPAEALIWLAKSYGVDLDELAEMAAGNLQIPARAPGANGNGQAAQQQTTDPRVDRLEQYISEQNLSRIETFAKQPGREHFDELSKGINSFLPGINEQYPGATIEQKLELAYNAALAVNPAVQAKVRAAAEKKAADAAEAQRLAQKGQRASAAAGMFPGSTNGKTPSGGTSVGTVYDDLSAVWDQLAQ